MIKLFISLITIMLANTFLGSSIAIFNKNFNIKLLLKGTMKMICIILALFFIYISCKLNSDIIIINIENNDLNLIDALNSILRFGIIYYGGQTLMKFAKVLKIPISLNVKINTK